MNGPPRSPQRARPAAAAATASRTQAIAGALQALARAARSLVLYDANNATVRHHLSEYHAKVSGTLQTHGDMILKVGPFQLAVAGEIVYEDRDREKSLAFWLYRDGIRELRILASTPFTELLELLQILAIRYAAVRAQEEDTVTLLRRAEFKGIQLDVVEGFTPAEEFPEPDLGAQVERGRGGQPPAGWDTPLQKLPAPGPLEYRPVGDEELAAVGEEKDVTATGDLAISLAKDLLTEATRASWPMPNRDLVAFFAELRDALLIDGNLAPIRTLVDIVSQAGASDLRDQMLRDLGDRRTLELVLQAVPEESARLPPELVPFLPLLGVGAALEVLATPLPPGRRELLTKVVLARLPREADVVMAHLATLDGAVVHVLAEAIATRAPERAAELARQLLAHGEALRLEGLRVVDLAPAGVPLRPIMALLDDPSEAVRTRAVEVLGKRGDDSVVDALCARLESGRGVSGAEAEAIGRALATVSPGTAGKLFAGWLDPKGRFLRGLNAQQRAQQWAAVAGTGLLPGPEAEAGLRALSARSDGDLRRHCLATLARRRKEGDARG
jgi:hypothetical protein